MRMSDCSSDVCPSDRVGQPIQQLAQHVPMPVGCMALDRADRDQRDAGGRQKRRSQSESEIGGDGIGPSAHDRAEDRANPPGNRVGRHRLRQGLAGYHVGRQCVTIARSLVNDPAIVWARSEEHTSELQSLMRISYAVFCLKKKIIHTNLMSQRSSYKS